MQFFGFIPTTLTKYIKIEEGNREIRFILSNKHIDLNVNIDFFTNVDINN